MKRLFELNSSLRTKLPPKRTGEPLFCEKPKKRRRLLNTKAVVDNVAFNQTSMRFQLLELLRALKIKRSNSLARHHLREIAKAPDLPSYVTMILLNVCVNTGSQNATREFLNKQTINLNNFEGGKLLLSAVAEDQEEIAAMLMRSGADLSDRKAADDNRTLLHTVLRSSEIKRNDKREELVRMLLNCGADVNACDNSGYSVLHDAIIYEHCSLQLVEELLTRGARVTVNKSCTDLNDIFSATCYKPELLPKLIEQQVPDEETRNQRGAMAIEYLISKEYTGAKMVDALQMVKKILDLGVPVNTVDPFAEERVGQRARPLLSTALFHKKKKAIKLLLQYGANPHQKDELGRTPLFQATKFKWHTHASRWLIKKGASIHFCNDDGRYPIHGACSSESLRNIHLFLSLGADLNVTDNEGCTPFSCTQETIHFNEAHYLVIKHFALIIAKGGSISDVDKVKINQFIWSRYHFNKCTKQLQRMKVKQICKEVSYFALFSNNMYSMIQLMKNPKFVRSFKKKDQERTNLFSNYSYMLLHSFEIAEKRYKIFLAKKKQIQKTFGKIIPDHAIEKITYYFCLNKLKRCKRDYYMSLHASLKNIITDKAKIL